MLIMVGVENGEYCFSDGVKLWYATDYEVGWGLELDRGMKMMFGSFDELVMFVCNEGKLWVKE